MKNMRQLACAAFLALTTSLRAGTLVADPVGAVERVLPAGWTVLRVEADTDPSYRPKGSGTAIFLGLKDKKYLKQQYSAVLFIMPSDYRDGGEDPTHGEAQSWPARLVAATDKAKIYLWPGSSAGTWKTMQSDLLRALMRKQDQRTSH
jgi:hypothetical protein